MKWSERRGKESKCSQWSNPESWVQYIYQYKIQHIIPNTFTNKESIAHKDSLHNQLKNFISYPSIVWGGGGEGLLITTPHYDMYETLVNNGIFTINNRYINWWSPDFVSIHMQFVDWDVKEMTLR